MNHLSDVVTHRSLDKRWLTNKWKDLVMLAICQLLQARHIISLSAVMSPCNMPQNITVKEFIHPKCSYTVIHMV